MAVAAPLDVVNWARSCLSSLRARLLLIVLLAVIPAFLLAIWTGLTHRRQEVVEAEQRALTLARGIADQQEQLIESARHLLVVLSGVPALLRHETQICDAILAEALRRVGPRYTTLVAAKPTGDVFCSSLPRREPVNVADRAYFRRALERREFGNSEYLIGRISGKPILSLAHPAIDDMGAVRAVIVAGLDLRWLGETLARSALPKGSSVGVIDRNGNLLARYAEGEKESGDWMGKPGPSPVVAAIRTREGEGIVSGPGITGVPRIFGFRRLHGAEWELGAWAYVGIPMATLLAEADRLLAWQLVGLSVAAALTFVVAYVFGHAFLTGRMDALAVVARRLGAGDRGARSGLPHDPGTLGQIEHAFDEMAESLHARQAEIERTSALLEAEHRRLYSLLDALPAVVFLLAPDYSIGFANGKFHEQWGDPGARRCYEAIHGRTAPCEVCPSRRVFETGKPETWESAQHHGSSYEIHAYPFRDVDGSPLVLELGIDTTRRKRAEAEVDQHREARMQSEKLAVMTELLAGVAHELNNPLSVIVGHAELLRRTARDESVLKRADKLTEAASRCARLMKNFLAIARRHPVERQEVQLNDVAREAAELVGFQLRLDNVEVSFELAENLPALAADPHQLHQVVVNLVTNAHHALRTAPPPRRLTLTTGCDRDAGRVWLEVADSGHGIAPENQARLFEPFFTTKPVGEGTGLGLPICKGIVESHGGTIRLVRSAVGEGAVFRVELSVTAAPPSAARSPETEPPAALGSVKVLVVEDEPDVSEMLAEILKTHGHEVDTAPNGVVALEALGSRSYDLVLSDIRMPELDGPGLYREVARRDPAMSRRFIFLTGDTLRSDTRTFIEESGARAISKPFTTDEVLRVVQETVADRRRRG